MKIFDRKICRKAWLTRTLGLLVLVIGVTACAEQKLVRGHLLRESQLQLIQIGISDKREVASILGSPTVESGFGGASWYYIGQRRTRNGFYPAELNALEVYEFRFDDADILQTVDFFNHDDLQILAYNENRTPTRGTKLTVVQQLLGNLGRFQTSDTQQGGVRDLLQR